MRAIVTCFILFAVHISTYACEFGDVVFDSDFETAKLDTCSEISPQTFLLVSKPENRPINHSPWYAFKVSAKSSKNITVHLQFEQESPRYLPKISFDGVNWQHLRFEVIDNKFVFDLPIGAQQIWVAGQEIINNIDYDKWLAKFSNTDTVQLEQLGLSTHKRPIKALSSVGKIDKEWLVLIGRQHPPEITGALAMFPFAERFLGPSKMATKFRQRFNLLIVPNLNPDGVADGNWRHNVKGIDLNRDWGKFTQVETKLVADKFTQLAKSGAKFVMAVDFHSTQQDVFYTMPTDYGMRPATLVEEWLGLLKRNTVSSFNVRNKPGSSPGRGIFKQYFADTYKVHAITYEMGDNTDRQLIIHVANQAADSLMTTLLATSPDRF